MPFILIFRSIAARVLLLYPVRKVPDSCRSFVLDIASWYFNGPLESKYYIIAKDLRRFFEGGRGGGVKEAWLDRHKKIY